MGIIGRQGFKKTIISYIGVFFGLVSTLYIYPLEEAMYGLARFLISVSSLLVPLLSFGTSTLVLRFFPVFRDPKSGHHGFLGLLLILSTVFFLIFSVFLVVWRDVFYQVLRTINLDVEVFSENLLETGVLVYFLITIGLITNYISNFQRIVVPGIFNSLYFKIGLPILILLFYFQLIHEAQFKWGLIFIHFLILASLVIYTVFLGEFHLKPDFSFVTKKIAKSMAGYSIHGVFASLGSTIAFKIDAIMTASMLGFSSTGIFSIADNVAGVIASPFLSLRDISAPIIAQELHDNDLQNIKKLYTSSSISMLIVGLGMLITAYVSLDFIFQLSAQSSILMQGKMVVLMLGLAKVIDMTGGVNGLIISFSKLYRWNIVLILLLAVLNIFLNYALIPIYGINGAALASLLSMTIFSVVKMIFVWIRFRLHPFTFQHLWVVIIAAGAYGLGYIIPHTGYYLLTFVLKAGITGSIFGGLVLYFKFSPEINAMVLRLYDQAKGFLGMKRN